jgi:hypothetical protein
MKEHLYAVYVSYATFGLVTDLDGKVTEAAPIGKWTIGKYISWVKRYFETKKGGTVTQVY